jgi:hypothetical protein
MMMIGRLGIRTVVLVALASMWTLLSGADGGCFAIPPLCADLDEAACLAADNCNAVYVASWRDFGGGCDELRCIGSEEVFERCENKPDCASFDEATCQAEPLCRTIYGFPEDWNLLDGYGPRCIVPPDQFIECLDLEADPCADLDENECLRRPNDCEPHYQPTACESTDCLPHYENCQQILYDILPAENG